jgi:hypothetical protein
MGRVKVHTDDERVTITGGLLEHDPDALYSRMTVNPILCQADTSGENPDTLIVSSRVMEAYRDSSKRLVAFDSVRMAGKELSALAGYAEFFSQGDSIVLRHSPVVWYQKTQVAGDSMRVYLIKRKLHRLMVFGNSLAVSQSDSLHPTRFDQMAGETMVMTFERQALRRIVVDERAIGVYHSYDDTTANGVNRVSGDRLTMRFDDGKLQSLMVTSGVEGKYYPENLTAAKKEEYLIPGALWRGDRPRRVRTKAGTLQVK